MRATEGIKKQRRKMRVGDWLNAVVVMVIGLFLGIAADGVMRLVKTDFWWSAVYTVSLFAALFFVLLMLEKLEDRFFPNRIRPPKDERGAATRPIVLLLSMPVGAAIGFVLGWLELATPLLDMLP